MLLALPLRHSPRLLPAAVVARRWSRCSRRSPTSTIAANFAKLAAATAFGFWFLELFERLSWVVLVAAIIPVVDSLSVWRGPTREIVTDQPEVFGACRSRSPSPDEGSFQLGLPDLLFFAVFLGAADRWSAPRRARRGSR